MEYKKYEYDNYTVHLFNTDKFKSIMVSTILINEFTKESLTKNALLRRLITTSSQKLKNETEVTKKVYSLYNAGVSIENALHNNVVSTDFFIEFLEDKYTEKGLLEKVLEYYFDTIFNPNIVDGGFESKNFNLAKKSLADYYDREKENKDSYANKRAFELLDEEYLRYPVNGYKECLDELNEKNMYEYYSELFKTANANIFIIGSFDNDKVLKIINDNVKGKFYRNENKYVGNNFDSIRNTKDIIEKEKNNQSKLVMLYKIIDMTDRERNVILPVFNRIFGVGSNSKLFRNVREKKSLAYNIRSTIDREDSIVTVFAGISGKSKEMAVNAVKEELKNIQDGNFSMEDLEDAKKSRKRILDSLEDENESILYSKISSILMKNDDIEDRKINLETVTFDEIVNLSNKLELSIIYMLEGTNENEKD